MKGIVHKMPEGKYFAFIRSVNSKDDHFFHRDDFYGHWEDLVHDFKQGNQIEVEFESNPGAKGPRASNVKRLDHPN